jgi:hypothetical protein
MYYLSTIVGFVSGLFQSLSKLLDIFKTTKNIEQGRQLEQAEQAKRESKLTRKETVVLTEKRTKKDVIQKLKNGKF